MRPGHTSSGTWLVLIFLLFGVLLPTGAVLWFMNEAATSQAEAARRSVTEAYRGQLRLLRDRVHANWQTRLAALEAQAGKGSAIEFQRAVTMGLADSIVFLDRHGIAAYPAPLPSIELDSSVRNLELRHVQTLEDGRNWAAAATLYDALAAAQRDPSLAARAAQGEIRCLLQTGDKEATLRAIAKWFTGGPPAQGTDSQERLIAADEQLLALSLMNPKERRYAAAQTRLVALVNDYAAPLPAAQRLFLMHEMHLPSAFPTAAAEQLAAEFLQAESGRDGETGLTASRLPGVWKLTPASERFIALFRGETVTAAMNREVGKQAGVQFSMTPPGASAPREAIAAGPLLPGWQIGFALTDSSLVEQAARRQRQSYLWVGYLVIAAMAAAALIGWNSIRRQWRLTRLRTDLVSAASHELRTPLASMQLLVDSLLEDEPFDPQKAREYLRLVAGENQRLTRLIENFLTFSRMERNRQKFEFTDVRADDVMCAAARLVQDRYQGCGVKVALGADLPPFRADRDALVTALLNLLDNACKYSPGEKQVELISFREDAALVFAVKDHGIGIARREQKRIFRKFYQVDQRLSRETGGCGLGLSIVDFIVRAHGGRVAVESRPGAGSTFRIVLPLDRNGTRAAA